MQKCRVDNSLTIWHGKHGERQPHDITEVYDQWQSGLSAIDHNPRTGINSSIPWFLGAKIIARPDLLGANEEMRLTSYPHFVRKNGELSFGSVFKVADLVVQTVKITREVSGLYGAYVDYTEGGEVENERFSITDITSLMSREGTIGQQGPGVGIREGYFLGAHVEFADGIEDHNWAFGPIYAFSEVGIQTP